MSIMIEIWVRPVFANELFYKGRISGETTINSNNSNFKLKLPQEVSSPFVFEWTTGKENPFRSSDKVWGTTPDDLLLNAEIIRAMVSGPELNLIRTHFKNLPWVINSCSYQTWTGDFAYFIACNFVF